MSEKKYSNCRITNQLISEDDKYYYVEGYASVFGHENLNGQIIKKGAFSEVNLKKDKVVFLNQHNSREALGSVIELREDSKGLTFKARMPKELSKAKDIKLLFDEGALDSVSIGFYMKDFEIKDNVFHVSKVELVEISIVTFPADVKAKITDFNSIQSVRDCESILVELGMSNKNAKKLISVIKNNDKDLNKDEFNRDDETLSGQDRDDLTELQIEFNKTMEDIEIRDLKRVIDNL